MQYTENDLQMLIDSVEKEFAAHLAKAEAELSAGSEQLPSSEPLQKAEEKHEEKEEEKKDEAPKAEEKHDEKAEEHKEEKEEHKEEAKPEHKEDDKKEEHAEHKEEAKDADSCDYDDEDMDHMHKMYMSMSKGELKAHHDSVRKALDHQMGKCGDMAMQKSEQIEIPVSVNTQEIEMLKSEKATLTVKVEELQKNLDMVQDILTKMAKKAPQGKAVTTLDSLAPIAKSEFGSEEKVLSKSEITSVLRKKSAEPSLTKSDRDAINNYYLTGSNNINLISHLLK